MAGYLIAETTREEREGTKLKYELRQYEVTE